MIFMEEYEYVSKKEYRPIEIQLEQIIRKVKTLLGMILPFNLGFVEVLVERL